jgi:hypothetical protein
VVDRWAVMVSGADGAMEIEEIAAFFARTRFAEDTPNPPIADLAPAREAIASAVDRFQIHLVGLRRIREREVQRDLDTVLDRLASLETRFKAQLALGFSDLPDHADAMTAAQKKRLMQRTGMSRRSGVSGAAVHRLA